MPDRDSAESSPALAHRWAGLPETERRRLVLGLVLDQVAEVLELGSAVDVPPDRAIRDLGLRSLTAVRLLTQLSRITGVPLATTTIYDYPTARALADLLLSEASGGAVLAEEGLSEEALSEEGLAGDPAATSEDPVAIVGMACRYPGGVATPDALWQLIAAGGDAISGFPADRGWTLDAPDDLDPSQASVPRHGGFLNDAALFDAEFFGISPREARLMDPQQRLLLETTWEVLERANVAPGSLRGSRAGVFIGANAQSYSGLLAGTPEGQEGHALTGRLASIVSGRIAYILGLDGPAITVDTACSSSLVALHLAIRSLRSGESAIALAGGVTVMPTPELFADFSKQGGMSPDGRCRAFASSANGLGWSEGVGVLLLERLSAAQRHGHEVLAILRGSAVNQDGASNGLTAPNGLAQQRVIRRALADAGLRPAEVDAVEAHGTGTTLGDPIEASALISVYGADRERPLLIGSVKSNIGHTQAAAGVAGVLKMVLAIRHGELPRTLHVDEPTPHVDWSAGSVELLREARPWPQTGRPRRAGVSSFGVSGTNAHVIIEQAPELPRSAPAGSPRDIAAVPWLLSARTESGLRAQAARLRDFVAAGPGLDIADVGLTLATRRSAFEHRGAVVGQDRDTLLAGLEVLAAGGSADTVVHGVAGTDGRVVFVFAGQGGQWEAMGTRMLDTYPVFVARLRDCERALTPYLGWSVTDVLRGAADAPALDRSDVVQPVLFALMVSLAAVWRAHGIVPAAVVGHSQGEIAAAYVSGALTLDDAARIVALRATAVVDLPGDCGMVFIAAPVADVERLLAPWQGVLNVAVVNSPKSVVVAGDREALEELLDRCDEENLRAGRVATKYASHSSQVEAVRDRLLADLAGIAPRPAEIPLYSTVTADWVDGTDLDAAYWYRNLRQPVRFEDAIRGLLAEGYRGFVEISPHPVLTVPLEQTAESTGADITLAESLRRDDGGPQRLLTSLAQVYVAGAPVDWRPVFAGSAAAPVGLPTYAFQQERYWIAPAAGTGDLAGAGLADAGHPLLAAAVDLPDGDGFIFTGRLSAATHPWLNDHTVGGAGLVPGTAFVELVLHAASRAGCSQITELTLSTPLGLTEDVTLRVCVNGADESGQRTVKVHSQDAQGGWTCHATAIVAAQAIGPAAVDDGDWPPADASPVPLQDAYQRLASRGFGYGPAFRGLRAVWRHDGEVFAEVALPPEVDTAGFAMHPALLDAATQAVLVADPGEPLEPVLLPFAWTGVTVRAVRARELRVRLARTGDGAVRLSAADPAGQQVVTIESLRMRPVTPEQFRAVARPGIRDSLFQVEWVPAAGEAAAAQCGVVGADDLGVTSGLRAAGAGVRGYPAVAAIDEIPDLVVFSPQPGAGQIAAAHRAVSETLALLQSWLSSERFGGTPLLVVTRQAVAVSADEAPDPAAAAVWGLVRSAQVEHPGRFLLADLDADEMPGQSLLAAAGCGEPQVAIRDGALWVPRLARVNSEEVLVPLAGWAAWRAEVATEGSIDGVSACHAPDAVAPLEAGQVRIAVRAAGVNFRDVLCALGMYPGETGQIGSEAAGVVVEVGSEAPGLAVGDRVMGLVPGSFGSLAVADRRLLVPIPAGWSFIEAASVPAVFLTAYYALSDLAGMRSGDRVLVHAAAGGVGMAAVQLARCWGGEVFGTASVPKHGAVRALGVEASHLASSRSLDFEHQFRVASEGRGVDIVVNSLAGEFVDASLRLLADGGRFVELGKTDIRDAQEVAAAHPGVRYQSFDVRDAGPDRIQQMLTEIMALFDRGELTRLPVRTWSLARAREALRFVANARHVGKVVLTVEPFGDPEGTVLITGAGLLGGLAARRLVADHGVRHLLLTSRRGEAAPGARELAAELRAAGATVRFEACDVTDRDAVAGLLAGIPAEHPLTAVVHTAGALDDGPVTSLTPDRAAAVLRPKVDAAWYLHEATRNRDLSAFVLFSSIAATLGRLGQASYGAANAFLDALAQHRRAHGLPGSALAWGMWAQASELTGHLSHSDLARLSRDGIVPMSAAEGLALFDAACGTGDPLTVTSRLDLAAFQPGQAPPLLRGLTPRPARLAARELADGGVSLAERLAALPSTERDHAVLDLVRSHAAEVLGHATPYSLAVDRGFKELGFDSLTAVELRNRLGAAIGLRLPATLVFDHPTPAALARHLRAELLPAAAPAAALAERLIADLRRLGQALAEIPADSPDRARVAGQVRALAEQCDQVGPGPSFESATADELFDLIDRGIS